MQFDSLICNELANLIRCGSVKCLRLYHCTIGDAKVIGEVRNFYKKYVILTGPAISRKLQVTLFE